MTGENKHIKQYTAADIQQYVEGKLSALEMHAIEKAALDDPFLADAIEGFENRIKQQGSASVDDDIIELQKRLSDRINEKRKSTLIPASVMWWQVAASLIVLIGAGVLTYNFINKNNLSNKNIAQAENKKATIDATPATIDTATSLSRPSLPSPNKDLAENQKIISKKQIHKINDTRKKPVSEVEEKNTVASAVPAFRSNTSLNDQQNVANAQDSLISTKLTASNFRNSNKSANGNDFTGKVVDMNSRPISGATVNVFNQKTATVTDNDGIFKLHLQKPDSTIKIVVNSVGFETVKAYLSDDNDIENNTVNLRNKSSSLSEVVVSGFTSRKKIVAKDIATAETMKNAEPIIGWGKYGEYLEKNKRISGDSLGIKILEVVSFIIKKNGKLSNFSIVQSYDNDFDDEAIRLIKNGPAWRLLKNEKTRMTLTIEF